MTALTHACTTPAPSDTLSDGMIRERVKRAMERRGWNLLKLHHESGVAYSAIHSWLSDNGIGTRGPSIENLEKIIAVLEIDLVERVTKPKAKRGGKR